MEDDMVENSQTGDILLYQTNQLFSKGIRVFTKSSYDHVAMIIRNLEPDNPHKVHVFEAVGGDGVRIIEWDEVKEDVGPNNFYAKIVYRKVDFVRDHNYSKLL